MNRRRLGVIAVWGPLLVLPLLGCARGTARRPAAQPKPAAKEAAMAWSLRSPAFAQNAKIPARHTGDGADVSPELSWPAPPKGAVEIALICDDPDAPGGHFVHWVIYGIPPDRESLTENVPKTDTVAALGGARQGRNDFGRIGYGGPAPPRGPAHHYHFTLYALDAPSNLPARAAEPELLRAIEGHVLARAELVGLYAR